MFSGTVVVASFWECFVDHHTGSPLEMSIKKRLHLLFWEKASEAFEVGNMLHSSTCIV